MLGREDWAGSWLDSLKRSPFSIGEDIVVRAGTCCRSVMYAGTCSSQWEGEHPKLSPGPAMVRLGHGRANHFSHPRRPGRTGIPFTFLKMERLGPASRQGGLCDDVAFTSGQ